MSGLWILAVAIIAMIPLAIYLSALVKRQDKIAMQEAELPDPPNNHGFHKLLKALNTIVTIMLGLTNAGIVIVIGLSIWFVTMSKEALMNLVNDKVITSDIALIGMSYHLPQELLKAADMDPKLVAFIVILALAPLILTFFFLLFVKRMIQSFRRNQIFTVNNGKTLQNIAVVLGVMSIVNMTADNLSAVLQDMLTGFSDMLIQANLIESFEYAVGGVQWNLVLAALLVWVISRAFMYGAFLQDEYDSTI